MKWPSPQRKGAWIADPILSVVVPCYNVEEYLEECIESIFDGDIGVIEVVCVDDGSTDDSFGIVSKMAEKHHEIVVIRQEHKGLGSARNAGLRHVRGKYVFFLDGDDIVIPESLIEAIASAEKASTEIVYLEAERFSNEGQFTELIAKMGTLRRSRDYGGIRKGRDMLAAMVANGDWQPVVWEMLYRRDFLNAWGLSFTEGIHEDEAFSLCAALVAKRTNYLPCEVVRHRKRNGSIMASASHSARSAGYFAAMRYVDGFLAKPEVCRLFDGGIEQEAKDVLAEIVDASRREYRAAIAAGEEDPAASVASCGERLMYWLIVQRG